MSLALYKSISDSWRIGRVDIVNLNKAQARDCVFPDLVETCRVSDVFVPADPKSETGKPMAGVHPFFRMQEFPEAFELQHDAALMPYSPLAALPSIIQLLRHRASKRLTTTVFGGNVALEIREPPLLAAVGLPSTTIPHHMNGASVEERFAEGITTAWSASSKPQVVHHVGHLHPMATVELASRILQRLPGGSDFQPRCEAALRLLSLFTVTLSGDEHAVTSLHIAADAQEKNLAGCTLRSWLCRLDLFDQLYPQAKARRAAEGLDDASSADASSPMKQQSSHASERFAQHNFSIFSILIYAFNHEEKERVFLNRKQVDFISQSAIKDLDAIGRIRELYRQANAAFDTLGIDFSWRLALFSRVSAVLHLLEMDFFEDGTVCSMNVVKSIARLLQLDMNHASKLLKDRATANVVAKWVYEATVGSLVAKLNRALDVHGDGVDHSAHASISIVRAPPPPSAQDFSSTTTTTARSLTLAALYEDIEQGYCRSSEAELVQWQRAGLRCSDELRLALDHFDNFPLIRLLRGKNGLLASFQVANAADRRAQLATLADNNPNVLTLTPKASGTGFRLSVRHSFGVAHYDDDGQNFIQAIQTIYQPQYQEIREAILTQSDVETQEVLYRFDQSGSAAVSYLAEDTRSLAPLLQLLQNSQNVSWWIRGSNGLLQGGGFKGDVVERQMCVEGQMEAVVKLRSLMPKRYLPCLTPFFISQFQQLLTPTQRDSLQPVQQAEAIFALASVPYLPIPDGFLVEGEHLVALVQALRQHRHQAASRIQAFARAKGSQALCVGRQQFWEQTVQHFAKERAAVQDAQRQIAENAELHKMQQADLLEKEQVARIALRDQCWIEWIALQTDVQQKIESCLQRMVAESIRKEESAIKEKVTRHHKDALFQLSQRVQQRLLAQGSHLDAVVREKEMKHAAAYRRMEKQEEIHKKLLNKKLIEEETRIEARQAMAQRQAKSMRIVIEREKQREEMRQRMWEREEKERVARKNMEMVRDAITNQMKEDLLLTSVEHTMVKRVAEEVAVQQAKVRQEQAVAMKLAKEAREAQMLAASKLNERQLVRKEVALEKKKAAEEQRRRRAEYEAWSAQERERKAAERLRREEEEQSKKLTRSLLKAHDLLQAPILFDQQSNGITKLFQGRGDQKLSPGFVMSSGNNTHPRMLSTSSIKGLMRSHSPVAAQTARRPASNNSGEPPHGLTPHRGTTTRLDFSSTRRRSENRDASPMSNFSI